MFLRSTIRRKDGKEHRYWSIVENKRLRNGRVVQRAVLYLGEINSSQELAWRRSIEVFEETGPPEPQRSRCSPRIADQHNRDHRGTHLHPGVWMTGQSLRFAGPRLISGDVE